MLNPRLLSLGVALFLTGVSFGQSTLTVTNTKGQSIEIQLVSVADNKVTFRRNGSPQEYTLALDQFDSASQTQIKEAGSKLPAVLPKIEPEVVIGKRRQYEGESWYMKRQDITCTVKLTNPNIRASVPSMPAKIVFIGQNTRVPAEFCILSVQGFDYSINPGATFSKELESFTTTYDSDNKGYGNVGGYQYVGYVLVLMDTAGEVLQATTATGSFRLAYTEKPSLLKTIITYAPKTTVNNKLEKMTGN